MAVHKLSLQRNAHVRKAAFGRGLLFGYKNHLGIDRRHGLIRTWSTTDAARHDGAQFVGLLDRTNTAGGVWADTAYRSEKNEAHLAAHGFTSRIHREGQGPHPGLLPSTEPGDRP
jgi:IS5 family transposase